jgi:DNA polymerase
VDLITVDFETYYSKTFGFKKLTTEQYVRSPDFEVIGVAVKVNDGETVWLSGDYETLKTYLRDNYDWTNSAVLAHNTLFDGAILDWLFDVRPKIYFDTLSMGRAIHGVDAGASLKALSEMYGIGEKGDEVVKAEGKRRIDFTAEELASYGDYCVNDVELTHQLFTIFINKLKFPKIELRIIDMTLRMFIEPNLVLDVERLDQHLDNLKLQKEKLLTESGVDKDNLMSNNKFAELLEEVGVIPPTKISVRTGKETYAFAKTDEEFKALQEHDDVRVQTLVSARLGLKSTLEETRTERFLDISTRGKKMPVPIKYYAAHTGRWGGYDKVNLQNLPSRGPNAKVLKSCMCAPDNHTIIQADSAQIEARVLAWLAEQKDLVQAFERDEDVYKKMASTIYNIPVEEVSAEQRFIGKTTILGAGYGMGAVRFRGQLKTLGVESSEDECRRIIKVYRDSNNKITTLWRDAQSVLKGMHANQRYKLGHSNVVQVLPTDNAIQLPSGLRMYYNKLKVELDETKREQYSYKTRMGYIKIYGGKVIENVCQAIARCVMAEQMLEIQKRYKVLLTVHDSVVCCVSDEQVEEACTYINSCMAYVPEWASGLPVRGDVEIGKNYGECIEWTPNQHGLSVV